VPTFNGDELDFPFRKIRFLAFAKIKRFKEALNEGGEMDLPVSENAEIDLSKAAGMKQHEAMRRNDMAIACLSLAFTKPGMLSFIYKSQDTMWPSGKAHLVMEALIEQYEPKDRISRVEMRTRLNNVRMSNGENPKKLFEQLAAIENAYKSEDQYIDEDDMIAVVLGQAPKAYSAVLATEQRIRGDELRLQDLEFAMNAQWRIIGAGSGSNEAAGRASWD